MTLSYGSFGHLATGEEQNDDEEMGVDWHGLLARIGVINSRNLYASVQ